MLSDNLIMLLVYVKWVKEKGVERVYVLETLCRKYGNYRSLFSIESTVKSDELMS